MIPSKYPYVILAWNEMPYMKLKHGKTTLEKEICLIPLALKWKGGVIKALVKRKQAGREKWVGFILQNRRTLQCPEGCGRGVADEEY